MSRSESLDEACSGLYTKIGFQIRHIWKKTIEINDPQFGSAVKSAYFVYHRFCVISSFFLLLSGYAAAFELQD